MGIFSFYENLFLFMIICETLFCLWESLLIYDHLWESVLFMRISSCLWSPVKIFPSYENLFKSLLICDHLKIFSFYENFFLFMIIGENLFLSMIICENLFFLWESFWISSDLWSIILLLIFYHTYPFVRTYSHILLSFVSIHVRIGHK